MLLSETHAAILPSSPGECAILISPPKCLAKSTFGGRVNRRKPNCRGRTWVRPRPLEQRFVPHSPELLAVKKRGFQPRSARWYLTPSREGKFDERPMASNITALKVFTCSFSCRIVKSIAIQGEVCVLFSFSAQARHPKEGLFTPWVKRLAA
jgi:hypothetical protein